MATSSRGSGRNNSGRNSSGRNISGRDSSGGSSSGRANSGRDSSGNASGRGSSSPGPDTAGGGRPTSGASSLTASDAVSSSGRHGGGAVSEPGGADNTKSAAKRLFDLRWLIAGMFVVYGIVLTITGIFDSQAELHKAAGVRINLWTGIGMFVVGVIFAAWARWRPLRPE